MGKIKILMKWGRGVSHLYEAGALFISQDSDQHAPISVNPANEAKL